MLDRIFKKERQPSEFKEEYPGNEEIYVLMMRLIKELDRVNDELIALKKSITYHAVVCPACFGFGNRLINLIDKDPHEAKCYLCKGEGVIYKLNYGLNSRE